MMGYSLRRCRMYDVEVETHKWDSVTIKAVPLQTFFPVVITSKFQ